jgi:uncharacterized protein (UPF0262 family)
VPDRYLVRIELPDAPPPPSAYAEADRRQAIEDLLKGNRFDPAGMGQGPFALHLMVREGRLILDIRREDDAALRAIILTLAPFRRLIKDYLMLVDKHEEAVMHGAMEARVQAIDMGRRGLHNEAAELLIARLEGRVQVDFDTARRLFTLIAALHQRV